MIELDQVILGVRDLDAAAGRLRDELGLDSVPGGRHVRIGTGNRIVPLGAHYVELLAVVDEDEARGHPFGRWVEEQLREGERYLGWCLRTDELETIAARLGLEAESWSRERPDGQTVRWRMAGLEASMEDPSLPFFIQWEMADDLYPGRAAADHVGTLGGITSVEVAVAHDRLAGWTGGAELPIRIVEGEGGVHAALIRLGEEEVVLRPAWSA